MTRLVLLLVALLCPVFASRRTHLPNYLRKYAQGPNICVAQQVFGTKDKYYSDCLGTSFRQICEKPTFISFQCCPGYKKVRGQRGCPESLPVENLYRTAHGVGLIEFSKYVRKAGLVKQLSEQGAYTLFAPSNNAFQEASKHIKKALTPKDLNEPSALLYHMIPGRFNITKSKRGNFERTTLYKDKKLRINKYAFGVTTVNCARVERTDQLATNGIVHVIDKVIHPLDSQGSLAEKIFRDMEFTQFQLALFTSDLANQLRAGGPYTVLAPTNEAFARLPNDLLDRILTDADTAQKVLKHHIIKGVYCNDAVVIAMGLKTLDNSFIMMRCKRDGVYFGDSKVVEGDIVAENGVIHAVDKVMIPDSVKTVDEFVKDLHLDTFSDLMVQSNFTSFFKGSKNITLLAPTDRAFKNLHPRYLAALRTQPLATKQFMNYHTIHGELTSDKFLGDTDITSDLDEARLSAQIHVNVYRGGLVVNNARITSMDHTCENGVVHKIDKVLMPPQDSIMEIIAKDHELSILHQALETTGLTEILSSPGQYTMLAPTNQAFRYISRKRLAKLMKDPPKLRQILERHIINRMVVECSVDPKIIYSIDSRQGDPVDFTHRTHGLTVNKKYRFKSKEKLATNGVLYKLSRVLPCSCEPQLRT
ncbi:transforming growth factor-beta-induced protein ig-h3-like isoform X2 [Gigantopelta aegis]|uniref:transforming growth factor-beta-induced protein ig-h3-like isoform X2 n=1 Tax=Gigantopelta aegis TaxID=1735272 RepID=UPI001B88D8E5|nr:transforming growth factor-beta-induced protein ig-h3-like isoform X2 [Gigantopelta aegis]